MPTCILNEVTYGSYVCIVCGVKTPTGRVYDKPPIIQCPAIPLIAKGNSKSSNVSSRITQPGTNLETIFERLQKRFKFLNLSKTETCPCKSIAAEMNRLGSSGCRKSIETLADQINAEAKKRISLKLVPLKRSFLKYLIMKAIKMTEEQELALTKQLYNEIKARLNGRTFDEALANLEKCKKCGKYQIDYCRKDKGCDKQSVFAARLARGTCQVWEELSRDSIGFQYFLTADMIEDCKSLIPQIPPNIDLIVGSARSGLIPASTLACYLHLPLASVSKHGELVYCGNGWRLSNKPDTKNNILLIEDTVYNGYTIKKCLDVLREKFPQATITTATVYVHPKSLSKVQLFAKSVPGRHYLEWNFFNSVAISRTIFDFDGILCEDIRPQDDDDGERYLYALENAIPKHYVRREPMPMIVTARLEKYRAVTLAWLEKHGMSCKKLVMGPWNTNEERMKRGEISRFKASVYSAYQYTLFVESDPLQAQDIANLTGKEVLCPRVKRVLLKKG